MRATAPFLLRKGVAVLLQKGTIMSDLVAAVVRRGIVRTSGQDQNGQPSFAAPEVEARPGDPVVLPQEEINRLIKLGIVSKT